MASSLRVTRSTNDSRKANTVPADSSVAGATNDVVAAPTAPARGRSRGTKAVVNTEAPAEETTPVVAVNDNNNVSEGPERTVAPAKKGKKKKGGKQPLKRVALTADQEALLKVWLDFSPHFDNF